MQYFPDAGVEPALKLIKSEMPATVQPIRDGPD